MSIRSIGCNDWCDWCLTLNFLPCRNRNFPPHWLVDLLPIRHWDFLPHGLLCGHPNWLPNLFPAGLPNLLFSLWRRTKNYQSMDFSPSNTLIEKQRTGFQIFFHPSFQISFFFQWPGSWSSWWWWWSTTMWSWWCSWPWPWPRPRKSSLCCATLWLDACDASAVWSSCATALGAANASGKIKPRSTYNTIIGTHTHVKSIKCCAKMKYEKKAARIEISASHARHVIISLA